MPPKYYDAPGAVERRPGETFASFSERQKASQQARIRATKTGRRRVRAPTAETFETKLDDLGESPDY